MDNTEGRKRLYRRSSFFLLILILFKTISILYHTLVRIKMGVYEAGSHGYHRVPIRKENTNLFFGLFGLKVNHYKVVRSILN